MQSFQLLGQPVVAVPLRLSVSVGQCFYCERELTLIRNDPSHRTRDHLYPKALIKPFQRLLKGSFNQKNIVDACHACNNAKGEMSPFEWMTRLPAPAAMRVADRLRELGMPHIDICLAAQAVFMPPRIAS